jgi:hypothetical protein
LLVKHDSAVAAQAARRVRMKDGLVVSDSSTRPAPLRPVAQVIDLEQVRAERTRSAAAVAAVRGRGVVLVGQAAAVVALAGLGAVTLMPHSNPVSASCGSSCVQAAPVTVRPQGIAPKPKPAATAAVAPTVAPRPTEQAVRSSYRKPAAAPVVAPTAVPVIPVKVPVVKVPKPVPPVTVPTQVPVPEVPLPTPAPTAASWNPLWPFGSSTSLMDLMLASMANGGTRTGGR